MREFYSERKPDAYSDQENRSLENPIFSLFLVFLREQLEKPEMGNLKKQSTQAQTGGQK